MLKEKNHPPVHTHQDFSAQGMGAAQDQRETTRARGFVLEEPVTGWVGPTLPVEMTHLHFKHALVYLVCVQF